jgi:hypothetical protein
MMGAERCDIGDVLSTDCAMRVNIRGSLATTYAPFYAGPANIPESRGMVEARQCDAPLILIESGSSL